jgi:hypothetical protein
MLVVTTSPVGTCSTSLPSGLITVMQPLTMVAMQMLPDCSTARLSKR